MRNHCQPAGYSLPWTRCHPADSALTYAAPTGRCGGCLSAHPWLKTSPRTRPWRSRWTVRSPWHRFPGGVSRESGPRSRPPRAAGAAEQTGGGDNVWMLESFWCSQQSPLKDTVTVPALAPAPAPPAPCSARSHTGGWRGEGWGCGGCAPL